MRGSAVMLVLVSVACTGGQTGDEGALPGNSTRTGPPSCAGAEYLGPELPQKTYTCQFVGDLDADAPSPSTGAPTDTPSGPYECHCHDRAPIRVDAADDCADALRTACDVEADRPRLGCGDGDGFCDPIAGTDDRWLCQCIEDGALYDLRGKTCEDTFTHGCAGPCTDERGTCTALPDSSGFDCVCEDGSIAHWNGVTECACGLASCQPACETGAGRCFARQDAFECVCGGASDVVRVPYRTGVHRVCPIALEDACGLPPAGERCEHVDTASGETMTCESDGEGDWICDCPTPPRRETFGPEAARVQTGRSTLVCDLVIGTTALLLIPEGTVIKERALTCRSAMARYCFGYIEADVP